MKPTEELIGVAQAQREARESPGKLAAAQSGSEGSRHFNRMLDKLDPLACGAKKS